MQTKMYQNKKSRLSGIGLIELLVALVLSSVVSIAVIQLFIQNKSSYSAHENTTRLQENGRYALQVIAQSLRSGDFWGCLPIYKKTPTATPDSQYPNVNGIEVNGRIANIADIDDSIVATDGATAAWFGFPDLPDTVTISGVYTGRSFPVVAFPNGQSGPFTIDVTGVNNTGIEANDLMIISDCNQGALFQVTNDPDNTYTAGPGPQTATVVHSTTSAATPPTVFSNNFADLGTAIGNYDLRAARVYHGFVNSTTYTVAMNDPDGAGPGAPEPTLMRNGQPLVPGIENLQIVWGIDTNPAPLDGQADAYVNTAAVTDWERVVSARISLVARSPRALNNTAVGYTMDGRIVAANNIPDHLGVANGAGNYHSRRVYSTTITFRNRAP